MTDREQARVDHVARAIIQSLGGIVLSEQEWLEATTMEEEADFIEACRVAARVAIAAADQVVGPVS
ncbi:hypothetical protein [Microvirga sp. G4-2]|uniref:hypothetical protein n=1 Tax=Microvirga sp. G4-2 TaxID=3434467 RepID=UPI004043E00C